MKVKRLLCLAALLALYNVSHGQTYHDGYTTAGGMVYRGGYFYYGTQGPYTQVYTPSCYSNGCYSQATYSYKLVTPVVVAAPYVAPAAVSARTTRDRLFDLAEKKLEFKGDMELAKTLGLEEEFRGMSYSPNGIGNFNYGTFGNNGKSIWGFNAYPVVTQQRLDVYNQGLDLNLLEQGNFQLGQQIAANQDKYMQGRLAVQGSANAGAAEVARIFAIKKLLEQPASTHYESKTTDYRPQAPPQPNGVDPPARLQKLQSSARELRGAYIQQSCISCHGGPKPQSNLDMTGYEGFTPQQKRKVWERMFSSNLKERMPQKPDGTPGEPVPNQVMQAFLSSEE